MRRLLLAAALAGFFTSPSLAYYQSGNNLLSLCTATDLSQCAGYVEGILDAWTTLQEWEPAMQRCRIPHEITTGQVVDVVVRYLQQHPEVRHTSASSSAINALGQAFCRS